MFTNFEDWRKAKERQAALGCSQMHFYRFEDEVLRFLVSLSQRVLVDRVEQQSRSALISLDDSTCAALLAFVEQARFGYIHPRRTSARFLFAHEKNRFFHPANPFT